jgi:transposase-like protein
MEFKNLKELMTYLKDEKVCREYYALLRWGGNPVCPHCNGEKPYLLKSGKYSCSLKTCKMDFSVTTKTIFENSKISLATWMGAMFVLSAHKKGISSCQLARDLGVTQKTAWYCRSR